MIARLVVLGATGDMVGRFLLPALAGLLADDRLPGRLRVVGAGQQGWDDDAFRAHVAGRLEEYAPDVPAGVRQALLARLTYRRVDVDDPSTVLDAVRAAHGLDTTDDGGTTAGAAGARSAVAVYLALPAAAFAPTIRALAAADLPPGSRIAVEKPFGDDRAGAVALNALLADVTGGDDDAVVRVDHILGMPRVRDLQRLRGPDGALAAVWDGRHVEQVDVLWEETLGLAGRTGFYDRTGALRDVLQNHLLQVLTLVAMEPPPTGSDADLHRAKAQALRSVRVLTPAQVPDRTRRARYTAGTLVGPDGEPGPPVPDYAAADGVDPARGTETWAQVVLEVDTPRWAGTRFVVRTGKALGVGRKGVALHFRTVAPPCDPADAARPSDRELFVELDGPARSAERPGVHVTAPGELSAYRQVLLDVLSGGAATSVSAEESELAWEVVEPVLRAWAAGAVPLEEYAAGSAGPAALPVAGSTGDREHLRPSPT